MLKRFLANPVVYLPIYPLVVPLFWPLLLIKSNIFQIHIRDGWRILAFTFIISFVFFFFSKLALRNWDRAAIATTLGAVLFNSFILMMDGWKILLWIIVAILTIFLVKQPGQRLRSAAPWANMISIFVTLILSINIFNVSLPRDLISLQPSLPPLQLYSKSGRPNIYLIILDSYARSDLLLSRFNYDNSAFLNNLRDKGFIVDDCAMSNYTKTELTMSSMFNLNYLDDTSRDSRWNNIRHSLVRSSLEQINYKIITFPTGFVWADIPDADFYITPTYKTPLVDFEFFWLRQNPLIYLGKLLPMDFSQLYGYSYYQRTMNALDHFPTLSTLTDNPIFAYIHIIAPHPPFVLDQQGNFFDYTSLMRDEQTFLDGGFSTGYTMELDYLNRKVSDQLDVLMQNDPDAIIIIMGDHGPWFSEGLDAYKIFFTYRFPGKENVLTSCTSPVNLFRGIFSSYFMTDLPSLNTLYFLPDGTLYQLDK